MIRTLMIAALAFAGAAAAEPAKPLPSMADILAASPASDWRRPDPANTVYMQLSTGRVVIELAPGFAPAHVENIQTLAKSGYFGVLSINRVQDNYVVQWGDPEEDPAKKEAIAPGKPALTAEFDQPFDAKAKFTPVPGPDGFAREVGFMDGFPVARDKRQNRQWLIHCYGMVGAGRDNGADTGSGAELYAVIGHAPRNLDRNVTLVGRVLSGIELLSSLPRGTGALGFYEKPTERVPIRSFKLARDVPEAERSKLEVLRTESQTFRTLITQRANRKDAWYLRPAGFIDVCNVPVPVRKAQ